MSVQDEGLEGGERAERTLELWRLALVLQIIAPHLVEFAAHSTSVAEDLIAHVHLPISWKQRDQVSYLSRSQLRYSSLAYKRKKGFNRNNQDRATKSILSKATISPTYEMYSLHVNKFTDSRNIRMKI